MLVIMSAGDIDMDISSVVKLYREFAKFTQTTSAAISRSSSNGKQVLVSTVQTQRDLERAEKVKFTKNYCVDVQNAETCNVLFRSSPQELNNEIWNRESKSGKYRAVVRKWTDKKKEEKQFLEIWTGSNKIENIDLSSSDKHGKVYDPDGYFGCFEWSSKEDKILFVAEKKYKKAVSYFTKPSDDKDSPDKTAPGEEYVVREDWGEGFVGKHISVLCILTISTGDINVIEEIPDNVSVGQVQWMPDDSGVIFTGWQHEPYRLGIIYCPMRKSTLFHLDFNSGVCESLSSLSKASNSAKISPDGNKFVYLQTECGGPHMQCAELLMYDLNTKETVTLVEKVWTAKDGELPGIYTLCLPDTCYSDDNKRVLVNTIWTHQNTIVVIDTVTKSVVRLPSDNDCCMVLLCIEQDTMIAECSSPSRPHYLVIGKLPASGQESKMKWSALDETTPVLDNIKWKVNKHQPSTDRVNGKYPNLTYESILTYPTDVDPNSSRNFIVFPHGGPHSVFTSSFMLYVSLFCKLGYSSLLVNYRGSSGYGSDSIYSLPGKCGDQDVKDVQCAAMEIVKAEGYDANRMFVWGGSHGGFLTCHLVGQYPDVYKASVCRNPVIDVSSKVGPSDIPDACYVEAGHSFTHSTIPNEETLSAMWKCSPLQYVDQITTPVMIMIGKDDRRVPPSQGYQLYKALKARNKKVRHVAYPDNCHPIVKVDSEADAFINIYKWFNDHLPISE
ncbi:hypothetical protein ACF0H5_014984 [Mactra antiquata]